MLDVHLTAELRIHARANSHGGSDAGTVDVAAANTVSIKQRDVTNEMSGGTHRCYHPATYLARKVTQRCNLVLAK